MPTKIAYFINQYPKVSHSFIRREIAAVEAQGFEVVRIALRGWDAEIVDDDDRAELGRTRYVLRRGMAGVLAPLLRQLTAAPGRFLAALGLALKMARRGERGLPYHPAYLAEAAQVAQWCAAEGVRHIHAHFGTNSAEIVMLAQCLGGPSYSFTVHGPEEFDKPQALGLDEKIRRSAFTVAITSFCQSQLYRWVEQSAWDKVAIVHCGLERAFYAGAPTTSQIAPRLVCIGRLCEQKGQLLLVEAAAQLMRRGVAFELVLAGDGEMRAQIEERIAHHDLQQHIRITGWISSAQVREELLAARAMVLPSFAEGLPVVIMEAMALRRPVLTTYIAGIPELVIHEENGWLFPAGDIERLTDAMQACLQATPEQLAAMGQAAQLRAVERHSVNVEAAKLARLFNAHLAPQPQALGLAAPAGGTR
ncbi:colanic acid biosynthesis glycosyltransferase WcaL [Herbaspirillum seropedicae]|uniref:glycosyltransferase family 4 protein n=1 Tax=Herbaspirillum seropedicae TaxID=964 RepID=UPI00111D8C68|nr:glycosyltransferase family 4 protein [Herbaspirillum seropedicae]QDD64416.1 colanic acid biosynthesis glycosyltransferase WcaL [Herbaspirillum seropedicae]